MYFYRALTAAVLAVLVCLSFADFNIPLPFGGLTFNKNPDGQVAVGVNQNVNIFGWGGSRGIKFTGGNGTFQTETEGGILANGTNFGGNSTFGADKQKGVTLDSDLNVGNETVKGGVGKESSFISGLADLVKKKSQDKKP
ncbi:hypothetical protein FO519_000999 [Halicephalobus sp. NKZ332]|nr:hypothetical protein FO519_000999 [Halicephalobus sp. NKZ332]